MSKEEGRKYDSGKPMMSLFPPYAFEEISKVLTMGAKKYDVDNWKYVAGGKQRYLDAMLRHINAYIKGEQNDPEFGTHHLAHAGCCLAFLLDADVSGVPLIPEVLTPAKSLDYIYINTDATGTQSVDFSAVTSYNIDFPPKSV